MSGVDPSIYDFASIENHINTIKNYFMEILEILLYNSNMASFTQNLTSAESRTKFIIQLTSFFSLVYHISILILTFVLKVYPICLYNIISVSVFAFLLIYSSKFKSDIYPYLIGLSEIVVHQILATYFLGTFPSFYYFILLMGLMPFILFDNNYKFSLPIGIVAGLTFIGYENLEVASKYELSPIVMQALRYMNMGITIGTIITMLVVFTLVVYRIENNLQNKNESLNKEIKLASVVQQNFFRLEPIDFDDWEVAYYNQPMAAVSGDLFDIYHRQNNIDGIGIFDISGHGLASGLVTMLVKNIIHQEFYKITDTDLAEILSRINTRIIQEKADIENYLTGILVRIGSDKIELVNAGHPFPILYKSKQKECFFVERLTSSIGVIGMSGMTASYKSQFVRMDPGDELILYTDGITDMENDKKITFGKDNLIASIKKNVNATVKQQILNISKDILNFKASVPSNDDVTMMILRRKA